MGGIRGADDHGNGDESSRLGAVPCERGGHDRAHLGPCPRELRFQRRQGAIGLRVQGTVPVTGEHRMLIATTADRGVKTHALCIVC